MEEGARNVYTLLHARRKVSYPVVSPLFHTQAGILEATSGLHF